MDSEGVRIIYCVDTSSLICLKSYPSDIFKDLWSNIEGLIREGRMIAPSEVRSELEHWDDEIHAWAKTHEGTFVRRDGKLLQKAHEIVRKFPGLIDASKETDDADPYVIALVLVRMGDHNDLPGLEKTKYIVVAEEVGRGPTKIPGVCSHYGIECIGILDMFRRESWKFTLGK